MIQVILDINLDVDMSCRIAMAKVTSQEYVVKNDRQTHGTATTITDDPGVTCMGAHRSSCMHKQTHESMNNDACGSTCTDDC